jgi:hypothetical protein
MPQRAMLDEERRSGSRVDYCVHTSLRYLKTC